MRARLINLWDTFRESFWFLPVIMSLLGILLATVTGVFDAAFDKEIEKHVTWLQTTPSAARSALSAIASAMITLTGVIFSITVVTVSMASSQYGSRLLRCFMTDSIADFVMGSFIGTGLFCLVTLRSVRDIADVPDPFTPQVSTAVAVGLGLFCVGLLIYFIHDVAVSIQATSVVEALSADLRGSIDRLYPDEVDTDDSEACDPSGERATESGQNAQAQRDDPTDYEYVAEITADNEGYIEGIDFTTLADVARRMEGWLELHHTPGQFLISTTPIASLATHEELTDEDRTTVTRQVRLSFVIGARRTPRQDVSCSVYELVEVALRALSPGINDPFTAMNCVDRLGAALATLARRKVPDSCIRAEDGRTLLTAPTVSSADVIHDAFRQLRQAGASSVAVSTRLIETFHRIAENATRESDFRALAREASAVRTAMLRHDPQRIDQIDFERRYDALIKLLSRHVDLDAVLSGTDV